MKIPLTKPFINPRVRQLVDQVLDSGMLTEGAITRKFEQSIKEYLGVDYAFAVCNCTIGLEIALRAIGIVSGKEVIVPDFTYPATAAAPLLLGNRVKLVDINPSTMLIDYDKVKSSISSKTKVIIPVSLFGNPLNYKRLNEIKNKYDVKIIEDAACSLGAEHNGNKTGTLADISVFSLHPRKFITTGEGGIITTNNPRYGEWIGKFKHFGIDPQAPDHKTLFSDVGGNYKLSNLQAAIGLAQMERITKLLDERRTLAAYYTEMLNDIESLSIPKVTDSGIHTYQTFTVFVPSRDTVIRELQAKGIEVQIGTYSLHSQPAYTDNPDCLKSGNYEASSFAFSNCLALPLYNGMSKSEQDQVVSALKDILVKLKL